MKEDQEILAVFIDFENLAIGLKDRKDTFSVDLVLARLLEKGNIVVKRAYADWKKYGGYVESMHQAAVELIEIPIRRMTGKNSADMRLCVDAMDMSYAKQHITTFTIVSGDSDFSPLVSKLRENGKRVLGLGMKASTSALLRDNCDEFIYYEDIAREAGAPSAQLSGLPEKQREAFGWLIESLDALRREDRDTLWSSLIKTTIKRKHPSFNESYYGYKNFSAMLEDAENRGLIKLTRDAANRTYIVSQFASEETEHGSGRSRRD